MHKTIQRQEFDNKSKPSTKPTCYLDQCCQMHRLQLDLNMNNQRACNSSANQKKMNYLTMLMDA